MAAKNPFKNFLIIDLDPITEVVGNNIRRKKDRKLAEFSASQVTFIPTLLAVIDCILPGCQSHPKYGIIDGPNLPVIFSHHDYNQQAMYKAFKTPICKPLRVPMDDDVLLNGIKWRLTSAAPMLNAPQGFFDCLFAHLKFLTICVDFCLECLFMHVNGKGLGLERFLRTVLGHIVVYSRYSDKEHFQPTTNYMFGMDLKFRRIHWEKRNKMFKHACISTKNICEEYFYCLPGVPTPEYPAPPAHGTYVNPDLAFLKNMDSVSVFHANVQCLCNNGSPVPTLSYVSVIRRNKNSDFLNISLAKWDGSEYSDPVINWSILGPEGPSKHFLYPVSPLASTCKQCNTLKTVKDIYVPPTTWLLMAEIPAWFQKCSVDHLLNISSFVLGGVPFELRFVLVYNPLSGNFTSLNLVHGRWFFLGDSTGGVFKRCDPSKVRYKDRVNLRCVFIRKTESDLHAHRCLQEAAKRS